MIRWAVHLHLILSISDEVTTSIQIVIIYTLGVQLALNKNFLYSKEISTS